MQTCYLFEAWNVSLLVERPFITSAGDLDKADDPPKQFFHMREPSVFRAPLNLNAQAGYHSDVLPSRDHIHCLIEGLFSGSCSSFTQFSESHLRAFLFPK